MLDSIFIGMSGLMGYSRGLRVIANNTANINTPGFKGATLQFGDLFYSNGPASGAFTNSGPNQLGQGLATYSTTLNFTQGELRPSNEDLDLAVDGQGMFVLKDSNGDIQYSRDGGFKFDEDGILVSRTSGAKVMAYDEHGALVEVNLSSSLTSPPKATANIKFRGNLISEQNSTSSLGSYTLTDVRIKDSGGDEHILLIDFKQDDYTVADKTHWTFTVKEGDRVVGSGKLLFNGLNIDPATAKQTIKFSPVAGLATSDILLDFSEDVGTFFGGGTDDIKVASTDGYEFGSLTNAAFDEKGVINFAYSNGQTSKGASLALARFRSIDDVRAVGGNLLEPTDGAVWETGTAGTGALGVVRSKVVEISNVDLSSEFSDLVIMQRGYQASSQVVSTANEMLQELFSLKGR